MSLLFSSVSEVPAVAAVPAVPVVRPCRGLGALAFVVALQLGCQTIPEVPADATIVDFDLPLDTAHGEFLLPDEVQRVRHTQEVLLRLVAFKYRRRDVPPRAPRDVHAKQHGCAHARLTIADDVPADLAHGLFATPGRAFDATVRFSSSEPGPTGDDWGTSLKGVGIKVHGVDGARYDVPGVGIPETDTQDFLLNNRPGFPLKDVAAYDDAMTTRLHQLITGPLASAGFAFAHPEALHPLVMEQNRIASPLLTRFWSQTPIAVGPATTKVSIEPCRRRPHRNQVPIARTERFHRDYLKEAVRTGLADEDACFRVLLQPRPSASADVPKGALESRFPVENASTVWPEDEAPFIQVATLTIPVQDIDAFDAGAAAAANDAATGVTAATPVTGRDASCDALHFNPWHAITAHRPLGNLNRSRRAVYGALARFRALRPDVPSVETETTTSSSSSSSSSSER